VQLRDVLARPETPLEDLVRPVHFVPEVASVLDLLRSFKEHGAAEAIVVDEHGGTSGIVTIENVFEEIVGDLRIEGERPAAQVRQVAPGRYRVDGDLLVRDWNEAFGRDVVPEGFETIGGLVTARLGRVPRAGDTVVSGGLACRVERMSGRRVLEVEVWPSTSGEGGASA
jgi:CBS domain containing-hemolysin-like protein